MVKNKKQNNNNKKNNPNHIILDTFPLKSHQNTSESIKKNNKQPATQREQRIKIHPNVYS